MVLDNEKIKTLFLSVGMCTVSILLVCIQNAVSIHNKMLRPYPKCKNLLSPREVEITPRNNHKLSLESHLIVDS